MPENMQIAELETAPQDETPAQELVRLRSWRDKILSDVGKLRDQNRELKTKAEKAEAAKQALETSLREEKTSTALNTILDKVALNKEVLSKHFSRFWKLDIQTDGKLSVTDLEGNPVKNAKDEPYEVSEEGLVKLMTDSPDAPIFEHLILASKGVGATRARGTALPRNEVAPPEKKEVQPKPVFGLR